MDLQAPRSNKDAVGFHGSEVPITALVPNNIVRPKDVEKAGKAAEVKDGIRKIAASASNADR